ncbi:ATP-binding protein [Sphaerisporangium sp. NPDC051017]|uniref:ATP-binding protein n=1 Tax=Sphaerisporangium sp. NPDC051017 TaxID=3154636 RepID=UPI00342F0CB6
MNGRDRETRPGGRHRRGRTIEQAAQRRWDLAERAAAHQLDQIEPGWTVWYGVGTRRYYAIATWRTPEPLIVQGRIVDELRDLMREAEQVARTRPVATRYTPSQALSHAVGRSPDEASHLPERLQQPSSREARMPETPNGLRTVCWDLPHDLSMVGATRAMVRDTLTTWALGDLADDVVLVADELLVNAINYGDPPIRLSLWASPGDLCVRVTDHGTGQPRHLDLGIESVHGRGLTIVAALAHDHGITALTDGPGKTVWARWRHATHNASEAPLAESR